MNHLPYRKNNTEKWYNAYTMKYTWYSNPQSIQSPDTIHQVLAYGSLDDIQSLKEALGEEAVKHLFLQYPKKVYTTPSLHFIKTFILHIHTPIDEQKYLKFTPRNTR